jgi:hypothetical protein
VFRAGVKVAHDLGGATDLLDDHVSLALLEDASRALRGDLVPGAFRKWVG